MRSLLIIVFALSPLLAQVAVPPPPPVTTDPQPGLFATLSDTRAKQTVLAQYHESYNSYPAVGDETLFLIFGWSLDHKGNLVVSAGQNPFFRGTTAYSYTPDGTKNVFGTTTGSCTQQGLVVTVDFVASNAVWFNPVANAYYAITRHIIGNYNATVSDWCATGDQAFLGARTERSTLALIKIK